MPITISVIVPVYNCEKYLPRCLDSIQRQTFVDFEVIMVNDGSTDASEDICKEYQKRDERFALFTQSNKGQASARNEGIKLARGEWLHFVDADDAIHPQMLETLYNSVVQSRANMSMCGFVEGECLSPDFFAQVNNAQNYISVTSSETNMHELLWHGDKKYWVVCGKLVRREIVERHLFDEGRIYEDNAVICKWIYDAGTFVDVHENLYFYFVNHTGTTKAAFSAKQLDRLWAIEAQSEFFSTVGYSRLQAAMDVRYILAAASCYRCTGSLTLKRAIRKRFRHKFFSKCSAMNLVPHERIYIAETFYPKAMRLYWILKKRLTHLNRRKYNE